MLNAILQEYSPEEEPEQLRKGKKVVIQEVDGNEQASSKNLAATSSQSGPKTNGLAQPVTTKATPTTHPTTTPQPLPSKIQLLKDKGNELFRTGQYSDALLKYSQAITKLQSSK